MRRKWHDRRVPVKISPTYRKPLDKFQRGASPRSAIVIGEANGAPPVLVQTNGMMVHGIRKDCRRWVTGTGVADALDADEFVLVDDNPDE